MKDPGGGTNGSGGLAETSERNGPPLEGEERPHVDVGRFGELAILGNGFR
jgi:hypothetical protein